MKTYSGSGKAKNPKKTKLMYWLVAVASVVVIAVTVTLAVVFSGKQDVPVVVPPVDDGEVNTPVDPPVIDTGSDEIKFGLPVENGTVIREAALTTLVYMPSLNMWKTHTGVDFAAAENAPVLAVADGKVTAMEETTLEGVVVTIEHKDGFTSVYKSLASASVKVGDEVTLGSAVGVAGNMMTESSDNVHVHLELSVNGEIVDPLEYIDAEINK